MNSMFKFKKKGESKDKCKNCIAVKEPFGKNKKYCILGWKIGIDYWACESPENENDIKITLEDRILVSEEQIYGDLLF